MLATILFEYNSETTSNMNDEDNFIGLNASSKRFKTMEPEFSLSEQWHLN